MSSVAPCRTERCVSAITTIVGGTIAGQLAVGSVIDARRLAAGREPMEGNLATTTAVAAWSTTNEMSQAALGRRVLPNLHWAARTAIELLGIATIPLLNCLEARGAYRASMVVRVLSRTVLAISVAALVASILAAAVAGQWLFVGCALGASGLSIVVEKGWLCAAVERPVRLAMIGLLIAQFLLTGAYLSAALILLGVIWGARAERNARTAAAGAEARLNGLEQPAVRPAIESFLCGAIGALDARSDLVRGVRNMPAVSLNRSAIGTNYHGLSLREGVINTNTWPSFAWPDWIIQDRSPEWERQMRDALRRHNPDRAEELRNRSVDQLWQQMQQRLDRGFESIRTHSSNGGAIADWRPLEACVQELLNQASAAATPEHRQRVRQALCGVVGRLQACGAGVDTALQEAVRDDLQGGSSVASNVLRFAAVFRQGVVEETFRRQRLLLLLHHGQTGVHALEEAALALPELNLPLLPVALRDPNVVLHPGLGTVLRRRLLETELHSPECLIEAVGTQLSASSQVVSRWLEERLPADSPLRRELDGHLGYMPVADDHEYPPHARILFFHRIAAAMLLDVGMLRPTGA